MFLIWQGIWYGKTNEQTKIRQNGWGSLGCGSTAMLPVPGGKWFQEMSMGNDRYQLMDIDNGDKIITAQTAVQGIKGTWAGERI